MKSLVLAFVLPACFGGERATTGQCPAGETCSDLTPRGLQFIGASLSDDANISGPAATAIGGTQDIALEYDPVVAIYQPLDLAYTADDDGGIGVRIDHTAGAVVSVRGMASRENYLRIMDEATGELFDRKELAAAAIDNFSVVPNSTEILPVGLDVAYAAGAVRVGVALYGAVQHDAGPEEDRLVDQSMVLSLGGATQSGWDTLELPSATAGTYPLAVTAGNKPTANVDVVVVDHLDTLVSDSLNDTVLAPNATTEVCFDGLAGGRYVAGLSWHFTVNAVAQPSLLGNCVSVTAGTTGPISVTAMADGVSATVSIAVGNARTTGQQRPARAVRPTAGDRAQAVKM